MNRGLGVWTFENSALVLIDFWLEDITDKEWNRDLREEIDLVFFLTRAARPHLKASHGVVVNMASLNGLLSFKTLGSPAHTRGEFACNRHRYHRRWRNEGLVIGGQARLDHSVSK